MWFKWYKVPVYLLFGVAFIAGLTFLAMSLWNIAIPDLFNGPVISFWQMIALLGLSWIFLHSWRKPYSHHGCWGYRSSYWKKKFEDKMSAMSPEDREKFKEEWKRHCSDRHWGNWYHQSEEPAKE